jgi:hypothetical protein
MRTAAGSGQSPFASPPWYRKSILSPVTVASTKYQKPHPDPTTDTQQYQQCRGSDDLEVRETARPAPNWVIGW